MLGIRDRNLLFLLSGMTAACAVGDSSVPGFPATAGSLGDQGADDGGTSDGGDDGDDNLPNSDPDGNPDDGQPDDGVDDDGMPDEGNPDGADQGMDAADDMGMDDAVDDMGMDDAMDDMGMDDAVDDMGMDDAMDDMGVDEGPPVGGGPCEAYAANTVFCFMMGDEATYEASCYDDLNFYYLFYGLQCATAYEDLFACIGSVSCMEYEGGLGCDAEVAAVNAACVL
ncbi:MAG: hypothetical protein AAF721_09420 [Myxococcota bacterium]